MVKTRSNKGVPKEKYTLRTTRKKRSINDVLDDNIVVHVEPLLQTCDLCQRLFNNKQDMVKHRAKHATVPVFRHSVCLACPFYTTSPMLLEQHTAINHPVISYSEIDDDQGLQKIGCTTAPEEVVPEKVAQEEVVPEAVVPEEVVPENVVPEEEVPDEVVKVEVVKEEVALEEVILEEVVPEEAAPEEVAPEEEASDAEGPDLIKIDVKSEIPDFPMAVFDNPVPIRDRIIFEQELIRTTALEEVAPEEEDSDEEGPNLIKIEVKSEIPDFSIDVIDNPVPIRDRIIFEDDEYDFAIPNPSPTPSLPPVTKFEPDEPQIELPSCPMEVVPSIEHAVTETPIEPPATRKATYYGDLIQPERSMCELCGMRFANAFLLFQHKVTHIHMNIYNFNLSAKLPATNPVK